MRIWDLLPWILCLSLGELEDTFDIELDENEVTKITTLEEALKLLEELQ